MVPPALPAHFSPENEGTEALARQATTNLKLEQRCTLPRVHLGVFSLREADL